MVADPSFAGEGDLEVARALVEEGSDRELFTYQGAGHLFADASLPDHDPASTEALVSRVLDFLTRIDADA